MFLSHLLNFSEPELLCVKYVLNIYCRVVKTKVIIDNTNFLDCKLIEKESKSPSSEAGSKRGAAGVILPLLGCEDMAKSPLQSQAFSYLEEVVS